MWNISETTVRTGLPPLPLRYYEQQRLITPARDGNGCRVGCGLGVERVTREAAALQRRIDGQITRRAALLRYADEIA